MRESFQEAQINKFLKSFGINQIDLTKPMFRLVWAPDQRELRTGEFDVYCGQLFIRTEVATKEVPKYSYIGERYILEQWHPPELAFTRELPDSVNGSYEILFVFEDKNGNRLPLDIKAIEMIMYAKFSDKQTHKDRLSRITTEMEDKDSKLTAYLESSIDTSDIQSLFHFKEAILCPDIGVPSQNLREK